jgi:hypothetical protein
VLPAAKVPKEAWVATIVEVPTPAIVTVDPLIVATEGLLLVYVNAPALFEVGGVKVKGGLPTILDGTLNAPKVGGAKAVTSNVAVVEAEA